MEKGIIDYRPKCSMKSFLDSFIYFPIKILFSAFQADDSITLKENFQSKIISQQALSAYKESESKSNFGCSIRCNLNNFSILTTYVFFSPDVFSCLLTALSPNSERKSATFKFMLLLTNAKTWK